MAKGDNDDDEVHFPRPHARFPTDIPCCVLFVTSLLAIGGIVAYSLIQGDTRRLTHGHDFKGRLCGVDPEVANQKYLYYCGAQGAWDGEFPRKINFQSRTCVEKCPVNNSANIACLMHAFHNFTKLPGGVVQNNLTFVMTLNLQISQSVTYQTSYPTEVFRGKYCVPQWRANNTLMGDVLNGPLRKVSNLSVAVGSFRHAWPVILAAAFLAAGLGILYLYLLRYYAGFLIFMSLCVGMILLCILGLFFLLGIFMNPWDSQGGYQRMNPLFRSFYGSIEAKAYSAIVGLCLLAGGAFVALFTWNSFHKIDECVGIISAACDCIFAPGPGSLDLLSQPFFESGILLVVIVLAFVGLMLACSVGHIDNTGIIINDEKVESLQKSFQYYSWWKPLLLVYVIATLWLVEYIIALGHFVVSYAVCLWYFTEIQWQKPTEEQSQYYKDAQSGGLQRVDKLRIQGLGNVDGVERAGYIEKGLGGKVLVVPIERKGPIPRDFTEAPQKLDRKEMRCGAVLQGFNVGLFFHTGSIALGSIVVPLTRPFRWISHSVRGLLGRAEEQQRTIMEDRSPSSVALTGVSVVSSLLDHFFGGYSKNAYAEMVLSSSGFFQSAHDSLDFLAEAGGAVAFLHGSTALYEMVGVGCITLICGGFAFLLLTTIPVFQDQDSRWFVGDPWMMTVLASGISCMIGFNFMSLFNVTADTLLYVFAWSRKHHSKDIEKYCPVSLRRLVGRELVKETDAVQLQARSKANQYRFQQKASRYAGTVMGSMRSQGAEQRPLLR